MTTTSLPETLKFQTATHFPPDGYPLAAAAFVLALRTLALRHVVHSNANSTIASDQYSSRGCSNLLTFATPSLRAVAPQHTIHRRRPRSSSWLHQPALRRPFVR